MLYDAVVVGGGMAGLTAAAYLARAGRKVLLLEKEPKVGGLVNSFERGGFVFDGGIGAIENSGIAFPMLRQLGIDIEFLPSTVSVGIERDMMRIRTDGSLADYQALLERQFPRSTADIARIIAEVRRVMGYMDVLYGIDNPLFLDLKSDPQYVFRTILPWMVKYLLTMPKVARLMRPVVEHLRTLAADQKSLYRTLDLASVPAKAQRSVAARKAAIADARGGDSVCTLFLAVDLEPSYFSHIASAHCFYTPRRTGLSGADIRDLAPASSAEGAFTRDKARILDWTRRWFDLNTFEISIPVLRDPALAPGGKTGIIVSTLMDHALHRHIRDMGWHEEYQRFCDARIVEVLGASIYPRLKDAIVDQFSSSPLGTSQPAPPGLF